MNVEERRRRRLAVVLAGDRVEDDREVLVGELGPSNVGIDRLRARTGLELAAVEALIWEAQDSSMRAVVLRKLDDTILVLEGHAIR